MQLFFLLCGGPPRVMCHQAVWWTRVVDGAMPLSDEEIRSIQAELFGEDQSIDYEQMRFWTVEMVREFFEAGGVQQRRTAPSSADFLKALDGETALDGTDTPFAPPPPPSVQASAGGLAPSAVQSSAEDAEEAGAKPVFLPGAAGQPPAQRKAEREAAAKARAPLPTVPKGGAITVDEAYAFLGVEEEERGDLEKLKARFRKACLKYHPDKNRGREKEAAEVFQAAHAAYHFLTTNNFDYKRWAASFTIPPLQSMEEVLLMALSGEDPCDGGHYTRLVARRGGLLTAAPPPQVQGRGHPAQARRVPAAQGLRCQPLHPLERGQRGRPVV